MRNGIKVIGACMALALAGMTQAADGVSLNAGRVRADDTAKLAKFYQDAFGMKEVQRIEMPNMLEIMLNFGDTEAAAKANPAAQVVIMQAPRPKEADTIPHIIFNVTDMNATVARVKAAGGKMDREPFEFQKSGIFIGMLTDPQGNKVELLQFPKK